MKNILSVILASIVFAGCASQPQFKSSDFAPKPTLTANHKKTIDKQIRDMLKDPDSAKIKYYGDLMSKGYISENLKGWVVPIRVNAKNSFGGYTGEKPFSALIVINKKTGKNGIVAFVESSRNKQIKLLN